MIDGQRVGRLRASFLLFRESFRFLRSDKEIMLFPILMIFFQLFLFGLLCLALFTGFAAFGTESEEVTVSENIMLYSFLFVAYVIGAFGVAFSQAGITHIVYRRIHGEDASFGDGFGTALSHVFPLFVWSLITSTVGMILSQIMERSAILGKIVAWALGTAWSVLTYFTVQSIVIGGKNAPDAIRQSGQVFRATWGETLVSNVSLGLAFLFAHLLVLASAVGLTIAALVFDGAALVVVAIWVLFVLWFFVAIFVQNSLESILRVLLYAYAAEKSVPDSQTFNTELLSQILGGTVSQGAQAGQAPQLSQDSTLTPPAV